MPRSGTTLRDLLEQAARKWGMSGVPASSYTLSRIAHEGKFTLNHTTISLMRAGTYPAKPKRRTLEAVAYLAGVPARVAFEAAGLGPPARKFAEQISDELDDLSAEHREVVLRVARALLKAQKAAERANFNPDRVNEQDGIIAYLTDEDLDQSSRLGRSGEPHINSS